ncbi:hypothetical protein [Pseudidiomarina homiensis]|uniref:Uncharacterized protein n=1 Tax=Pseudidiomarina homiensis TaxID=364198 RepID=A0A432XXQ5_9GAMM|nr:hypothetical protein [Pseudidiomarina homiensis]RUO53496.1 hypothetical protein CWI70_09945 [Pseudidiomarina homiensis]
MLYVILWLILCVLVGAFASSRGRSFIGYALLAVIISPLIAFIIVAVLGQVDKPATASTDTTSAPQTKKDDSDLDL